MKLVTVSSSPTLARKALECLCELTAGLQYRLAMLHDPSLTHTDPVTSYVTYLTTTRQHPNTSGEELAALLSNLEDTDGDKMRLLQAEQLRVDQYCHLIIGHCVAMLLDVLNKELVNDKSGSDSGSLLCGTLRLLHSSIELLRKLFCYHEKLDDANELQSSMQVLQ